MTEINSLHQPHTYLFMFEDIEDVKRFETAALAKHIEAQKLSDKIFLGFFSEHPATNYPLWKQQFGIQKGIHWVRLPYAEITK